MQHKSTISIFLLPKIAPKALGAEVDLSGKNKEELKQMLDEKGIEYKSNATKQELIDLLGG